MEEWAMKLGRAFERARDGPHDLMVAPFRIELEIDGSLHPTMMMVSDRNSEAPAQVLARVVSTWLRGVRSNELRRLERQMRAAARQRGSDNGSG